MHDLIDALFVERDGLVKGLFLADDALRLIKVEWLNQFDDSGFQWFVLRELLLPTVSLDLLLQSVPSSLRDDDAPRRRRHGSPGPRVPPPPPPPRVLFASPKECDPMAPRMWWHALLVRLRFKAAHRA